MPTYRIDIAYDGTAFRGYARNRGVRTVQGELERAISVAARTEPVTEVAGRTDAGVHARHNVVGVVLDRPVDPAGLQHSVNRMLGPEIVATSLTEVDDGFSARFDATSRCYRYLVDNGPVPDPMMRWRAWHSPAPLDTGAMSEAAGSFVGEHDFASLCRRAEGRATVRRVDSARWWEEDALVVYEVEASSFCHQMVRSMVAMCVEIGRGRLPAASVAGILAARDRNAARGAAPAHGLTLWQVRYRPDRDGRRPETASVRPRRREAER